MITLGSSQPTLLSEIMARSNFMVSPSNGSDMNGHTGYCSEPRITKVLNEIKCNVTVFSLLTYNFQIRNSANLDLPNWRSESKQVIDTVLTIHIPLKTLYSLAKINKAKHDIYGKRVLPNHLLRTVLKLSLPPTHRELIPIALLSQARHQARCSG